MSLRLTWLGTTPLPVDGSTLRPEGLRDRTPLEASRTPLRVGNGTVELGEQMDAQLAKGAPKDE